MNVAALTPNRPRDISGILDQALHELRSNAEKPSLQLAAVQMAAQRLHPFGDTAVEARDLISEVAQDCGLDVDEIQQRLRRGVEQAELPTPAASTAATPVTPIQWLDMSAWDVELAGTQVGHPRPRAPQSGRAVLRRGRDRQERQRAYEGRRPRRRQGLVGSLPEQGPAFYIGAEDDKDEIHIRLAGIATHYGVTFEDLTKGGLRVLCLLGQDATLCIPGRGGKIKTTALYRQLYEAAGDIKPKNISIDTLSRAFAGNEIDRVQVYAFAQHMQALAKVAGGSVTVLSHPSLQGINNGSGISGSTAWHGAFRFRQYLKGVKATEGEQPNGDLRELQFLKNQYGPLGETIVLRYQRGVFVPEGSAGAPTKAAAEAPVDDAFLRCLDAATAQGRTVSDSTGRNYAPAIFEMMPEATASGDGLLNSQWLAFCRLAASKSPRLDRAHDRNPNLSGYQKMGENTFDRPTNALRTGSIGLRLHRPPITPQPIEARLRGLEGPAEHQSARGFQRSVRARKQVVDEIQSRDQRRLD
jgi:hypothetical protein